MYLKKCKKTKGEHVNFNLNNNMHDMYHYYLLSIDIRFRHFSIALKRQHD